MITHTQLHQIMYSHNMVYNAHVTYMKELVQGPVFWSVYL